MAHNPFTTMVTFQEGESLHLLKVASTAEKEFKDDSERQ